jgi:hypothetical protein
MGTSKRFWALCAASAAALVAAAPGCNDNDNTEICVGPECPQYDGVGGERNFFRRADPEAIDSAGSAGASGEAGMAGSAGSGGEQPDVESPDATTPDGSTPLPPACQIAFTSPALGDAGELTVDGTSDADGDACGSQFVLPVALTSNASSVTLFVNDAPLSTQDVVDGAISFDAVLGNRGSTPNVLRAEATMADNSTCSLTFSSNILVDCAGPSCSITAPASNADGYLNDTQDIDGASGFQTDIVVGTEAEQVGQSVRLEIDGAFDTVPDAQVLLDSNSGIATFGNVTLAEGSRTVRAECSDAFGLKTLSAPAAFDVDVTPCTISISSIAGNANPITPGNDQDPGTAGIQVLANGTITGGDCKALWIGVCNGALTPLPLTLPQDGSFSLPVTLTGSNGSLDICGAVEDLAGNFSSQDQVTVNLRLNAPQVAIVSPAPSTRFNLLGTSGAVADGDALTPGTCEAAVVVNCTELGQNVDLLADGRPIAQATCLAQGGLPSPFVGQATFVQASLPTKNDGGTTLLTARETATGFPATVSAGVSVQADCEAPTCTLVNPSSSLPFLNLGMDSNAASGFQINFDVQSDANSLGQSASLIIDGDANGALSATLVAQGGGTQATFVDVALAEGPRTAQARCVDAAGNVQSSSTEDWTVDSVPCSANSIVVASGASPITPAADSDPQTAGLQVTANGQATGGGCTGVRPCGSIASFAPLALDESFSALPLTLGSSTGSASVCLELQDVAGNVGQGQTSVLVRVDPPAVAITSPVDGARFNAGTSCSTLVVASCSDVNVPVQLSVDGVVSTQTCQGTHDVTFAVNLVTKNDGSLTSLSVLQTANGMTSAASSINVQADCQVPVPSITAPGCGTQSAIPENDADLGTSGLQMDVVVANDGAADTTVTITRGVATSSASTTGDATTTTFTALDLGGAGSIDLVACVTDPQGNQGCTASCALTIADHPNLSITSPADQSALLASTPDCNAGAAGLDVTVQGASNAANGSQVQLQLGAGAPATTTVVGGFYSTCVAAPQGLDQNLTVTVTDGTTGLVTNTSVQVDVDSTAPITPIAAPSFSIVDRRLGKVTLTWNPVNDAVGATLSAYHLRCAATDITSEGTWNSATVIPITTVPTAAGSPTHSEDFGDHVAHTPGVTSPFRTGTKRFCVIRGENLGGQLTPIAVGQSVTVINPFATAPYDTVMTATSARVATAAIGDVNGDGEDDFIVGSEDNAAQVFFGGSGLDTTPGIIITGIAAGARFGTAVAGLGDINGDGRPDFAVAAPFLANGAATFAGSVFIFLGRAANDPWPLTPITVAANPGCGADICIHGTTASAVLGTPIFSTNFDGVGPMDLVIGVQNQGTRVGRVYILLGGAQFSVPTGTVLTLPGSALDGFVVDPPTIDSSFGASGAAVGSGTDALGDIVIGALGRTTGAVPGAAYFLAGQAHPGAGAGLVAATGLTLFATGTPGGFAGSIAGLSDFDGDGFNDVCVNHDFATANGGGNCNVYLGQANGFAGASSVLNYANNGVDNDWAFYTASGFNPGLGAIDPKLLVIGDLDGDGRGDLALGSQSQGGAPPDSFVGTAELFYGDVDPVARIRVGADAHFPSADQGHTAPAFVGDVNGDGFNDLAVFDTDAGTASRLTLLY